jgi:hypothetical protein
MSDKFEGWVVLELMGHRRLGGYLTEQEVGGVNFLRLEIPAAGKWKATTQLYSAASVYCITPTTAAIAKACAKANHPAPIHRWELPPASREGQVEDE